MNFWKNANKIANKMAMGVLSKMVATFAIKNAETKNGKNTRTEFRNAKTQNPRAKKTPKIPICAK